MKKTSTLLLFTLCYFIANSFSSDDPRLRALDDYFKKSHLELRNFKKIDATIDGGAADRNAAIIFEGDMTIHNHRTKLNMDDGSGPFWLELNLKYHVKVRVKLEKYESGWQVIVDNGNPAMTLMSRPVVLQDADPNVQAMAQTKKTETDNSGLSGTWKSSSSIRLIIERQNATNYKVTLCFEDGCEDYQGLMHDSQIDCSGPRGKFVVRKTNENCISGYLNGTYCKVK